MAQQFVIRDYEPGDEDGIVELLNLVFKGWPHFNLNCTPVEHWRWKYLDNPHAKRTIPVITMDGKIVGTNHGVTRRAKIFDGTHLTSQGADLAVHPDYRRLGIYEKSSEYKTKHYLDNGFSFAWAVTGNPVVFDSNLEWGRRGSPHKVNTLLRVNDVDLHFKMMGKEDDELRKIGAKILKGSADLSAILSGSQTSLGSAIEFREVNMFDGGYSSLWAESQSSYDLIFDRSPDYMNWRYLDRRAGDFKVIAAMEDGVWLGYMIYRVNRIKKDYPEARIADVQTLQGRPEVASDLLLEAFRKLDEEGVNATYSWALENSPYLGTLQRLGCINSRYAPYFIYQNINLTSEWEAMYGVLRDRMCIHLGDSDWV